MYLCILWTGYLNSAINPLLYVLHLDVRTKQRADAIEPFSIFFLQFKDVKKVFSKYVKICLCNENVNTNEEEEQVK